MKLRNLSLVFLITLLLMTALASLSSQAAEEQLAKGEVLLYTSVPKAIITDIENVFEAKYPEVDLVVFRTGTGKLQAKIATELEVGNILADLIWVADPSYYLVLKEKGLLLKYDSPEAVNVPAEFKDPGGYYYAGRLINMIIAYNTNLVSAERAPQTWIELILPEWKDQIIMANPLYSGAKNVTVGALTRKLSWRYYNLLRANGAVVVRGNSDAARKIAAGEFKLGFTLDNIALKMAAAGSPIAIVYPRDGTVVIPSPIAIIKTAKNPAAAKLFLDYILTKEGQEIVVEKGFFIPIREDVEPPAGAPTMKEVVTKAIPIEWSYIKEHAEEIKDKFSEIMLY